MVVRISDKKKNYSKVTELLVKPKKFMPQYKEYVENFKWAFDRRCLWSNMGGVEGSLDDGLTKFKDNFNPTINELIGEFDIPVYPFMYRLTQKAYEILKSKHK